METVNPENASMNHGMSPEEKAEKMKKITLNIGRLPPSSLLELADECDGIPELLEQEQAAYLVPYYTLMTEIKRLIRIDDKHQFASFLIDNRELVQKYPADGVLQLLCRHSAVGCATVLLQFRLDVDINMVYHTGMSPLQLAAHNLSYGMTKLLLEHGAKIHLGVYKTPIFTALDAFKKHKYIEGWTVEEPILKLFYYFCLPELKEPLDTLRLLASHINEDECLENLYLSRMAVGCVEDYAALLLVARDKLMVSSAEGGLETTPVGQHISQVLSNESIQQEICELYFYSLSKEMLVKNFTTALDVVKTMWKVIGVLERYYHSKVENVPMYELPLHITHDLVKEARLDLQPGAANMQCDLPKLTSEPKYHVEPQQPGPIFRSFQPVTGTSGSPPSPLMPGFQFQHRTVHFLNRKENHLWKTPQVKPSSHIVLALPKVCAPLLWFAKRSIK